MKVTKVSKYPNSNNYDVFVEHGWRQTAIEVHERYVGGGRTILTIRIPENFPVSTQQLDGIARRIDPRNRVTTATGARSSFAGQHYITRVYSH
jgi:hypothetical protein